jgi:hypothetical protein
MLSGYGRSPVAGRRAFASMMILYLYAPENADLISLALNSMNAMSLTGAISEEEFAEARMLASRIAAASGNYESSRLEIRSRTNIDLGPEQSDGLEPEDLMDVRFAYYLP